MDEALEILKRGGIGILPTDTLYGVVALALQKQAVERVYTLKGRAPNKPVLMLIHSPEELRQFGITLSPQQKEAASRHWPGPITLIFQCPNPEWEYLHRGHNSLAFRVPADEALRTFIEQSGPIIAPSANPEGMPPATKIEEARAYFGDSADFYIDAGVRNGNPSMILALAEDGTGVRLR